MLAIKPLHVNAIAEQFDISRQAVSLHLQFLNDCGLINIQQQGRERYCRANLDKLDAVTDWVSESKKIWMQRFQSLEKFLQAKQAVKDRASKVTRKNKNKRKSHGR